jgi:phosphatidylglycerol:prolipoprotein diacylglycerol transferase
LRDQFSPMDAINATQIPNATAAYAAIANNPIFSSILAQVPAKHPTQLYEAFLYIFVFAALYYMYWNTDKRNYTGYIFGMFLVLLFTVRFIVESVKESQGGFESALGLFYTGQWLSIPFVIIGLYFVFTAKKQHVN